eukprot:478827-Alexandrium_andersonii.AAC.1
MPSVPQRGLVSGGRADPQPRGAPRPRRDRYELHVVRGGVPSGTVHCHAAWDSSPAREGRRPSPPARAGQNGPRQGSVRLDVD